MSYLMPTYARLLCVGKAHICTPQTARRIWML